MIDVNSILKSIKTVIGLELDDTSFDSELILHTNSILTLNLWQLGIGPTQGFSINSDAETWDQVLSEDELILLESVKSYVGLSVKRRFDPPTNSTHMEALNDAISEAEWRLSIQRSLMNKEG